MRNHYFDFLRGIAIMMVVALHTSKMPEDPSSINDYLLIAVFQITMLAVPIFVAISGYFLANKQLDNKEEILAFWRHQIPKVYIPMLIWSIPYVILKILHGSVVWKVLLLWLIGGLSIYYFIALILQCYLFLPRLKNIKLGGVLLLYVGALTYQAVMIYLRVYRGYSLPTLLYAGLFPKFGFYFALGIYLRKVSDRYRIWPLLVYTFFALGVCVMESLHWHLIDGNSYDSNLSAFIFTPIVIAVLFHPSIQHKYNNNEGRIGLIIRWIGSISFGIYLIHRLFEDFNLVSFDSWFVSWLVTIVVTILCILLIRLVIPKISNKYLGLYKN